MHPNQCSETISLDRDDPFSDNDELQGYSTVLCARINDPIIIYHGLLHRHVTVIEF